MDEITARIVQILDAQLPFSRSLLADLETLLHCNTADDQIDLENLYNEIATRNISLTSLTNGICSAMESKDSLLAAKVYLLLLLSPNSPVFTLFTPMAFLALLRAIRLAMKKPALPSMEGSPSRNPRRKKKEKGSLGRSKRRVEESGGGDNEGEDSGFDVNDLFFVLEKLEMVLGLIHLDRFSDCLKSLVGTVCEIPVMAIEGWGDMGSFKRLSELSLRVLSELLKVQHGNQGDTATEILKRFAPLILSFKSHLRNFGFGFLVNKMMIMGQSSDEIMKAVANMPKYLVQKAPEKAEGRALAVDSIVEIVKALDAEHQIDFADYVMKMSLGKGQLRLLAVDFIPVLIMSLSGTLGLESIDGNENSRGLRLLEALIQRCSDSTAGIRARALTNLAQVVVSLADNEKARAMLKDMMGLGHVGDNWVNGVLKQRCLDEKAAVRKAALLLISKMTTLSGGEFDEELLKTVGMACSDPLVSIRKVAVSALSEAFRRYTNSVVIKEWVHSVPRLISDNETSIQEECEDLFLELLLDRIARAGSKCSENNSRLDLGAESFYPEGILSLLNEVCDGEVAPWVKKICTSLGKKKKLKTKIATSLQNIIRTSETHWLGRSLPIDKWIAPPGAWFLLSEVSLYLTNAVDWEFLQHHWQLLDKDTPVEELKSPLRQRDADLEGVDSNNIAWVSDRVFLLQTISNVSTELPPEPAADLAQNFLKRLEGFYMHSTEVNAHVKALKTLCRHKTLDQEEADSLVIRWVNQLLSKSSDILDLYMSKVSYAYKEKVFCTPQTGFKLKEQTSTDSSKLSSQAVIAMYTIGSLVIICPSASLKAIVPTIHNIITSGSSDTKSSNLPGPQIPVKQLAPSLYIQSWVTMGKICLADGKLAKRYIPLFVQELEKSESAALRNNIVVIMADFCVRYTAIVDCYMSKITKCLRDPCELVRRQTFVLLSRLLQRDYVKWRGILFLRFLLCLVDESEKIRQLADFLFGNILKAKAPLLAYNSFVEAIFVLNDWNAQTGRSNTNSSRSEKHLFSIRGNDEKSRSQRMHIYTTLLKQMAPEHLLATFAKVCAEILAAASDGMISIEDNTGQSVLRDAFAILSSKEIRVQPSHGSSSSESTFIEEDDNGVGSTSSATKGRAITQAVRKGLIQNAIPIFIELKRLLESKNSPLIGSLMDCLRILLKDYKNEIDDILVADRQLQKELLYDMKKYETMKTKNSATNADASVRRPEMNRSQVRNEQRSNDPRSKLVENLRTNSKVASVVADVAAEARAKSVLREVNRGTSTPLSAMSVPKLKSCAAETGNRGDVPAEVLESLRRRQTFNSDDED